MVGDSIHLEPIRSLEKAIDYVRKNETRVEGPFEFGKIPAPGDGVRLTVRAAKSMSYEEKLDLTVQSYLCTEKALAIERA